MKDKKSVKLLIFDFDMTLVNSHDFGLEILRIFKEEYGLETNFMKQEEMWMMTEFEFAKRIAEYNDNKLGWQKINELDKKFMKNLYINCSINDCDFLRNIQSKVNFSIVSNNNKDVISEFLSSKNDLNVKFDPIYGAEEVKKNHAKAESDSKAQRIKKVVEKYGLENSQVAYIGDHYNDVISAKEAGVISIGITSGIFNRNQLKKYNPDYIISRISSLNRLFNFK
jgi:phosphoglycolate phosphatase